MLLNGPETLAALSVTTSAQRVTTKTNPSYVGMILTPTDGDIYYGGAGVTTSSGQPILSGKSLFIATRDPASWYLISAGTVNVRVTLITGTR